MGREGESRILVPVLTGLAPALQSGRGDLTTSLKSGARVGTYHRSRTRVALLVIQGALSVVLLVGAGLFVRSLDNVSSLRMGYDVDPILWVSVEERGEKLTDDEKGLLRDRLAETARSLPNVASSTRAVTVPFWMTWDEGIFVAGIDSSVLNGMGSFVDATVEFLQLEGGCWSIKTAEDVFQPIDLPPDFRQDGLRIRVSFKQRNDMVSICMIGPIIEILSIRRR